MDKYIRPTIAVTTGEPAGIGPDICLKLACQEQNARLVFIGCPELLEKRALQLDLQVSIEIFGPSTPPVPSSPGQLLVMPEKTEVPVQAGKLDERNSFYVIRTLERALQGCQEGVFHGVATAPVHKGIINAAGIPFSGHTEWFAQATGTSHVVMMLACEGLKVALVTTHLPLSAVPAAITPDLLKETLKILHSELQQKFKIRHPHIFICGLNPHAGESGYLGREEIEVISPVIAECRSEGMKLTGPLPADTLFSPGNLKEADAVLAMYHDQGLPVLKFKGFGEAVNITLGLPVVRTSVDHGTALDLAGTGLARTSSLQQAIYHLVEMVQDVM